MIKCIHVVLINPESGHYIAYDKDAPDDRAYSHISAEEAVGSLIMKSLDSPVSVVEVKTS